MRIVAVSISTRAHALGGMEDHLHTLMGGLARQGHRVTVLTSRHPEGVERETVDGVEWIFLDCPRDLFSQEWGSSLLAALADLGPHTIDVVHSQSSSALPLLDARIGAPVVISLHGNFASIVSAAAASAVRERSVRGATREAWGVAHVARVHFRQRNWRAFRPCEAIVPSRSQVRPSVIAHALHPDRVHVVLNAVDSDVFQPRPRKALREKLGLDPESPTVVIAGRLDRSKGTSVALEAVAASTARDVSIVVVGDGPDRAELERSVVDLGLAGRVLFTGREPQERVAQFLAAADLFLFPSQLAEAFSLVVAQAMACGTPVVASSVGAVPEVLGDDEVAGVLVRPGDAAAMTTAIDRLLADQSLRDAMGHGARRRALERFSVDRMVRETVAVYQVAMNRAT